MAAGDEYVTKQSGANDDFGTGATRDSSAGKPRYDLIPPGPLRRVAMVYMRGGQIRGDMNWTQGMGVQRMIESAIRHLEQYRAGETDEDHAAQAVWNLLGAMHFEGSEWDDRYDWSVPSRPVEVVADDGGLPLGEGLTHQDHVLRCGLRRAASVLMAEDDRNPGELQ